MNAVNLYINACRLVMQAEVDSKEFCMEVYKLLPSLRQSLSCTVCGKLLSEPYTPTETLCQHHVCKNCIGNKKRLKPSCSWCKNYESYVENTQIKIVIQCFIKLCSFMEKSGMIQSISRCLANGGHCSIREIVDEVISTGDGNEGPGDSKLLGVTNSLPIRNGITTDDTISSNDDDDNEIGLLPIEENLDDKIDNYIDDSNNLYPQHLSKDTENLDISIDSISPKIEYLSDSNLSSHGYDETLQSSSLSKCTNIVDHNIEETVYHNSNHLSNIRLSTNLYEESKTNLDTVSNIPAQNSICNINANLGDGLEYTNNIRKIENNINYPNQNTITIKPSTSSLLPRYTLGSGIKQIGIYNPILDTGQSQPTSHVSQMNSMPQTTVSCVFTVPPSAIFSTKSAPIESSAKVTMPTTNSSYSVMYCDSENTKITFKRKPPDIENVNSNDQFKYPHTDVIKKIRPKPKEKPKRKGCRCGNATPTPGKLTCCGQRCPCYVAAKACIECQCRGCRNPHRPGGKKVRPIIPQFENIKIHQIQPVHPRPAIMTTQYQNNNFNSSTIPSSIYSPIASPVCGVVPTTIRTLHAVPGIGSMHAVSGGMHHLINLGSRIVHPNIAANITLQQNQEIAMKQINLNMPSIPTQFILNNERLSNQSSDSDIDIDVT